MESDKHPEWRKLCRICHEIEKLKEEAEALRKKIDRETSSMK